MTILLKIYRIINDSSKYLAFILLIMIKLFYDKDNYCRTKRCKKTAI